MILKSESEFIRSSGLNGETVSGTRYRGRTLVLGNDRGVERNEKKVVAFFFYRFVYPSILLMWKEGRKNEHDQTASMVKVPRPRSTSVLRSMNITYVPLLRERLVVVDRDAITITIPTTITRENSNPAR